MASSPSGITYQYVRELAGHKSILKLGMSYPLPFDRIRELADRVGTLIVVESSIPSSRSRSGLLGSPWPMARTSFRSAANSRWPTFASRTLPGCCHRPRAPRTLASVTIPGRPPASAPAALIALSSITCAATSVRRCCWRHRLLLDGRAAIRGDGYAHLHGGEYRHGARVCSGRRPESAIATIGDSTSYLHGTAGLCGLQPVEDCRWWPRQPHHGHDRSAAQPRHGHHAPGRTGREIDIAAVCRAMGVTFVEEVNAWDVNATQQGVARCHGACRRTGGCHCPRRLRLYPALPPAAQDARRPDQVRDLRFPAPALAVPLSSRVTKSTLPAEKQKVTHRPASSAPAAYRLYAGVSGGGDRARRRVSEKARRRKSEKAKKTDGLVEHGVSIFGDS